MVGDASDWIILPHALRTHLDLLLLRTVPLSARVDGISQKHFSIIFKVARFGH